MGLDALFLLISFNLQMFLIWSQNNEYVDLVRRKTIPVGAQLHKQIELVNFELAPY